MSTFRTYLLYTKQLLEIVTSAFPTVAMKTENTVIALQPLRVCELVYFRTLCPCGVRSESSFRDRPRSKHGFVVKAIGANICHLFRKCPGHDVNYDIFDFFLSRRAWTVHDRFGRVNIARFTLTVLVRCRRANIFKRNKYLLVAANGRGATPWKTNEKHETDRHLAALYISTPVFSARYLSVISG